MTILNEIRSLTKGTGPETDIGLRDFLSDKGGFALIAMAVLLALLA